MRADEIPIRIGIVGPQFADPVLFVGWLARRFGLPLRTEAVPVRAGPLAAFIDPNDAHVHDRILHTPIFWVAQPVTAMASVPAYLHLPTVFDRVLERSDVVVLMLTRAKGLLHLNPESIAHVARWAGPTVAVINDPYCNGAGHYSSPPPDRLRLAAPEKVAATLPSAWPVHRTHIGSFSPELAQCDEGTHEVLSDALRLARPIA